MNKNWVTAVRRLFDQPYPLIRAFPRSLLRLLVVTFVVALIFAWARPEIAAYPSLVFRLPVIVILAATSFSIAGLVRFVARLSFAESSWTVGREIALYLVYVALIALSLLAILRAEGLISVHAGHFLIFPVVTVSAASLPAWLEVIWTQNHLLRQSLADARELNNRLSAPSVNNTYNTSATVLLVSETGSDIRVMADKFIAIQAQQNYCALFLISEKGVVIRLIRSTFGQALGTLGPLGACQVHRSWAINRHRIKTISANAQGCQIKLDGLGVLIPVSRRYRHAFV
ncbi:MAG: hypothetical protein DHS20C06_07520 [Hyphobacterium sp.]|nr:MAG: hypothetical protein DHS20C06_07520 [Hyphobacterium sp.]